MSTVVVGTIQSNSTSPPTFNNSNGTEIGTLCRAFVNFNGTGTVAIRSSFNVSSITDNGTGDYTVNFTTAMPDANYSVPSTAGLAGSYGGMTLPYTQTSQTTSGYRFRTLNNSSSYVDMEMIYVAVFR